MQALSNLLLDFSLVSGFSVDKINFLFCISVCLPLGLVFRFVFHPDRVSSTARRIVGLSWGLSISLFLFGWDSLILVGVSLVCYVLTILSNPKMVHRYVFISAMGTLSVAHIYRQFTDYGGHSVDFSGPLMLIVQKVIYVAFSVHDGGEDEETLTEEQRMEKLREVPSLVEYMGYLFHFSMFQAGPVCTFKQYRDFIDGSDIRPQKPGQKEPSPLREVMEKISSAVTCLLLLFLAGDDYPITRNGDPSFISTQPFYWRVIYAWVSVFVSKLRYFFAFKMGEAVNNICGLGFGGFDDKGRAKWDTMVNVNILKFEFATNMKMVCDNWNVSTALWLRRIVYDRCTRYKTVSVFIVSSIWHGFYPGYYLMFLSLSLMIEAARLGRRTIRPYFQKSRALALFYDVITCIITSLCVVEGGAPFQLLEIRLSLNFWASMYYYGHIWCLLVFLFCRKRGTKAIYSQKTKNGPAKSNEENKNWIYKLDYRGVNSGIENATRLKLN